MIHPYVGCIMIYPKNRPIMGGLRYSRNPPPPDNLNYLTRLTNSCNILSLVVITRALA